MERDDYYLDSFCSSLKQYLDEVLIDKNCVSSNFRKYSVKNEEDVEFSFLLKLTIGFSFGEKQSFNQVKSSSLTEEVVKITSDGINTLNLTEYRLYLLKAVTENLLKVSGYKISSKCEGKWIHFAKESSNDKSKPGIKVKILCGPVVNSHTKRKETLFTTSDYHKLRLRDMLEMYEKKKLETCNEQLVERLADACVKMALLQTKSNQAVSLNLSTTDTASRETASKGAGFLQYNASRMAAIRKKYERLVAEGLYTTIPEPEDLNFELLKEPEEWALFFNFLLEYPTMISKVSEEILEGRANIHRICNFLSRLCSLFSAYYRRVRILLEPKKHLFPTIHARLVLVMSVEQILENGLATMNIKKIEEM